MASGFIREGVLRDYTFERGRFVDNVVYARLLASPPDDREFRDLPFSVGLADGGSPPERRKVSDAIEHLGASDACVQADDRRLRQGPLGPRSYPGKLHGDRADKVRQALKTTRGRLDLT